MFRSKDVIPSTGAAPDPSKDIIDQATQVNALIRELSVVMENIRDNPNYSFYRLDHFIDRSKELIETLKKLNPPLNPAKFNAFQKSIVELEKTVTSYHTTKISRTAGTVLGILASLKGIADTAGGHYTYQESQDKRGTGAAAMASGVVEMLAGTATIMLAYIIANYNLKNAQGDRLKAALECQTALSGITEVLEGTSGALEAGTRNPAMKAYQLAKELSTLTKNAKTIPSQSVSWLSSTGRVNAKSVLLSTVLKIETILAAHNLDNNFSTKEFTDLSALISEANNLNNPTLQGGQHPTAEIKHTLEGLATQVQELQTAASQNNVSSARNNSSAAPSIKS